MAAREVVVVDSVRTGLAKAHRGSFNLTRSDDMLAHCIDSLLERNPNVVPEEVEDVVVGAANHTGEQDGNLARLAVVLSRLPITAAGMTINRFCSSGLQSIAIASNQIASGQTDIAMAGGVDSISMGARQQPGKAKRNQRLLDEKPEIFMAMGNTAEVVARRYQVTREMQDEYALQSQMRYAKAQSAGWIGDEIVPMDRDHEEGGPKTGEESWPKSSWTGTNATGHHHHRGPGGAAAGVRGRRLGNGGQRLPAFDGASMTLLMSAERANHVGIAPMGVYRGFTVAACEPDEMGIGPVFAIPRLLENMGLRQDDVDLWELNEAFASQCVYCRNELDIDNEKYNVNGGSISIGHPFGMTGSRCTGTILRELERRSKRYGVVTMCIGGGQGAAGLFERA